MNQRKRRRGVKRRRVKSINYRQYIATLIFGAVLGSVPCWARIEKLKKENAMLRNTVEILQQETNEND